MDRAQLHAWLDSYEPRSLADLPVSPIAPPRAQIVCVLQEISHRCEEVILPIEAQISTSDGFVESPNLSGRPAA